MKSFGIEPHFLVELDQSATCFSLVSSGIASGFVADSVVRTGNNLSGLLIYKIEHPAAERDSVVYTKHTGIVSKATREFIRVFLETSKKDPDPVSGSVAVSNLIQHNGSLLLLRIDEHPRVHFCTPLISLTVIFLVNASITFSGIVSILRQIRLSLFLQ